MERLRFYFGIRMLMLTFACRWQASSASGQGPVFVAAVLDAPADLLTSPPAPDVLAPVQVTQPSEISPGARSPEARSPEARKPVRFLWRTDAEDRFLEVTPPLREIVGDASASLIGRTVQEACRSLGLDPAGALAEAIAKRVTWSGIEVLWPIASMDRAVPVGLGALPAFDCNKRFEGFHGFGVIYEDRAVLSVRPSLTPVWESAVQAPELQVPERQVPVNVPAEAVVPMYSSENVVLLRPLAVLPKAVAGEELAPAQAPVAPPRVPETRQTRDLSSEEQDAFRQIARALTDDPDQLQIEDDETNPSALGEGEDTLVEPTALAPDVAQSIEAVLQEPVGLGTEEVVADPADASLPVSSLNEGDSLNKNAGAIFSALKAGLLVLRNEDPVFANRFLLDLLDFPDLAAMHRGGALSLLLKHAAPGETRTIEFLTRQGANLQLNAQEQCIEWDHFPASLFILRPMETVGPGQYLDGRLAHYENESRELNAILDTATDGVAVLDSKGKILTLNRSGEALFGYDQNEVVGEHFSLLFNAESRAIAEDYLDGLKSHGMKSLLNDGREVVGLARQGGLIPIFMTLGRITGSHADDGDVRFCALLRDMTHWKKVEQELDEARQEAERASALKSDFLAKVSHEIRTPLNAILGFAEVIMEERFGPVGNERYKDYLKDIHMSGAHVMSLVNDLLDLSKIEAGKLELNFQDVDANRIISECVMLMQPQANSERVIMRMSLSAQLPHVFADERSLRQIILNLLSNAVKFNEPGGQVIVATVLADSGHAVIRIKDTGIGMSEEDIGTALEPFRQLATKRQTIGTGLGLPLTKALVEANRAFFSIKSKKQEGTLVEVTFPVMRVSA